MSHLEWQVPQPGARHPLHCTLHCTALLLHLPGVAEGGAGGQVTRQSGSGRLADVAERQAASGAGQALDGGANQGLVTQALAGAVLASRAGGAGAEGANARVSPRGAAQQESKRGRVGPVSISCLLL